MFTKFLLVCCLVGLVAVWVVDVEFVAMPLSCRLLSLHCPLVETTGRVTNAFHPVQQALQEMLSQGAFYGATVAVWQQGELVVDLAGGRDLISGEAYQSNRPQLIYSSGKVVESIAIALLVEQGLIQYSDLIVKFWPEFGENNSFKAKLTISDLLRHDSNLAWFQSHESIVNFQQLVSMEQEPNVIDRKLENMVPSAGDDGGNHIFPERLPRFYHGVMRGLILDGIVRRIDPSGRHLCQLLQDVVGQAIGHKEASQQFYSCFKGLKQQEKQDLMDKTYFYIPFSPLRSFSLLLFGTLGLVDISPRSVGILRQVLTEPDAEISKCLFRSIDQGDPFAFDPLKADHNSFAFRSVVGATSSNVHTNAHVLAQLAGEFLLTDHLFSEDTRKKLLELDPEEATKRDYVLNLNTSFTQGGVSLMGSSFWEEYCKAEYPSKKDLCPKGEWYGWTGAGGSFFVFSIDLKTAFSFVPSSFHTLNHISPHGLTLLKTVENISIQ
eukprot:Lithocolla_globosa_v1_NODE_477_length_3946_cov_89.942688.p1 type:complete len:494 gc:universal NODE_477_length_3946_cov_89.942688:1585-104(-)